MKGLYTKFLKKKRKERITLETSLVQHTYMVNTDTQDKTEAKRVDLFRGKKTDRLDVTLQPEEIEVMNNVVPTKYEEARKEERPCR